MNSSTLTPASHTTYDTGDRLPKPSFILRLWVARYRQRQQLLTLQTWQLDDIGISAEQARAEGRKPFWRG